MKAVLSNRIFLNTTPELTEKIDAELTYKIPAPMPMDPPIIIKNMGIVNKNIITMPIGRVDLIPEGYEIVDKRVYNLADFPSFKLTLRTSQKEILDDVDDNCMINAKVSWGKTFTGLALVEKLGQKTLIIVHNASLRNQWVKEIKKVFGIYPGILGSGQFDMGPPIQVGNIQTLYRRIPEIKKSFGLIILDECHHVSANTFSKLIDSNNARYKIGLSGTLKRKDGKHVVFQDYFGTKIYRPPMENFMVPTINIVKSGIPFIDGASTPWATRVNQLVNNEDYVKLISLLGTYYASKGHKVLIVSDRVEFLKNCATLVGDTAICITGDNVPIEDREAIEALLYKDKNQLYGSISIYKEGISINCLSCIIVATPVNNDPLLEQLMGRIGRVEEGKLDPILVDIHLVGNTARKQANDRMSFYIKQGLKITQV